MAPSFGQSSTGERSLLLLAVLLVLSLVCVTLYAREGEDGTIHTIQHAVSGIVSPVKAVSGGISVGEQSIGERFSDATADPNSITSLREQNEQLRQTVAELEEYRQEAIRLEGLLDMKTSYNAQGLSARILSRPTDPWNLVITIDAGAAEGVRAGLPVMAASGLIGQVVATSDHTADIRLLQDPQSGVAAIVQSNREEGIVYGSLDGLLYLEDLGDEVEVQPGDVVLTSGLGGGYFRGIMVGTVLKVEGEAGATSRKIIIEPTGESKVYEEVYVVTSLMSPYESLFRDTDKEGIDTDGDGIPDTFPEEDGAYAGYDTTSYGAAYGAYDDGIQAYSEDYA